jgi:hypothetical protein
MNKQEQVALWLNFVDNLEPGSGIEDVLGPTRDLVANEILKEAPRPPKIGEMLNARELLQEEIRAMQSHRDHAAAEEGAALNRKREAEKDANDADVERSKAIGKLDTLIERMSGFRDGLKGTPPGG